MEVNRYPTLCIFHGLWQPLAFQAHTHLQLRAKWLSSHSCDNTMEWSLVQSEGCRAAESKSRFTWMAVFFCLSKAFPKNSRYLTATAELEVKVK